MFESLYEKLPEQALYWKKLGLTPPVGLPDRDILNRMIHSHLCAIPFENLDVCDYKRTISLGIPDLFDKIIAGQRGGYCFELNALFHALLAETGFDVSACIARSLKDRGYVQPVAHRGLIVSIDGQKLYCDVGYGGPMAACALPLIDGLTLTSCGQLFRIERRDGPWWAISYGGSVEKSSGLSGDAGAVFSPVLTFLDIPLDPVDFVPLSHYCSTHPTSVFTQWRMVNRRTEDGSVSITADNFVKTSATGKEEYTIESECEFRELLVEHFGIELPA